MVKEVKNNIEGIKKICRKMQLQSLYLFGSGSTQKNHTVESDLDFIFKFKKNENGNLKRNKYKKETSKKGRGLVIC